MTDLSDALYNDIRHRDPRLEAVLGLIFDDAALRAAVDTTALLLPPGPVRVGRLRYKQGTSVHAAVSVGRGSSSRWLLLAGYAPSGLDKLDKDLATARRYGARHRLGPGSERWVIVEATADRAIFDRRETEPAVPSSFQTVAYNPRRRLVGRVEDEAGSMTAMKCYGWGVRRSRYETVQQMYHCGAPIARPLPSADRSVTCSEWLPGRPVDLSVDIAATSEALSRLHRVPSPRGMAIFDVGALDRAVHRTLRSVAAVLPELTGDLADIAKRVNQGLRNIDLGPLGVIHGDLSPDQAVVTERGVTFVDVDDCMIGPAAWDRATWVAAQLATDDPHQDLPGPICTPLLAAAVALRSYEPFQRRRPGWLTSTVQMLDHVRSITEATS